jgi:hypothetical protein
LKDLSHGDLFHGQPRGLTQIGGVRSVLAGSDLLRSQ